MSQVKELMNEKIDLAKTTSAAARIRSTRLTKRFTDEADKIGKAKEQRGAGGLTAHVRAGSGNDRCSTAGLPRRSIDTSHRDGLARCVPRSSRIPRSMSPSSWMATAAGQTATRTSAHGRATNAAPKTSAASRTPPVRSVSGTSPSGPFRPRTGAARSTRSQGIMRILGRSDRARNRRAPPAGRAASPHRQPRRPRPDSTRRAVERAIELTRNNDRSDPHPRLQLRRPAGDDRRRCGPSSPRASLPRRSTKRPSLAPSTPGRCPIRI